jgi:hypothetical protein
MTYQESEYEVSVKGTSRVYNYIMLQKVEIKNDGFAPDIKFIFNL